MAGLFRRFRKEKEAPVEESLPEEEPVILPEETPGDEALSPETATPTVPAEPTVREAPATEVPEVRPSPSLVVPETGPPPPLPRPSEDLGSAVPGAGPGRYARCFVCGSKLDGPWCPTCRMVWND
jgi:hypothetical protein